MCDNISMWSKDRSTKTGCVIVKDRRVLTTGFNGFCPGVQDDIDDRHQRPAKYFYTEHCDRNAIYQAARFGISLDGATMYLTGPPCHDCARGIIMAGIKTVIWPEQNSFETNPDTAERWKESVKYSLEMLSEAKVGIERI